MVSSWLPALYQGQNEVPFTGMCSSICCSEHKLLVQLYINTNIININFDILRYKNLLQKLVLLL